VHSARQPLRLYLLKLDAGAIENALGLAATQSAGLRLQFGSESETPCMPGSRRRAPALFRR